jgi:hypothetical protein
MTDQTKDLEMSSAAFRVKDMPDNSPILKLRFNPITQVFSQVFVRHLHACPFPNRKGWEPEKVT